MWDAMMHNLLDGIADLIDCFRYDKFTLLFVFVPILQ
jgi:hypothetical protein